MLEIKIKSSLMRLFNIVFIITFGYILFNIIFSPSTTWNYYHPFLILVGGMSFLLVLTLVYKKFLSLSEKRLKYISYFNFGLLIALQIFFILFFLVNPTWDFGIVFGRAIYQNDLSSGLSPYFYVNYPNNIPLFLIFNIVIKILNFLGLGKDIFYLGSIVLLNMLLILIAVICTYYLIKNKYGLNVATFFSFLMLLVTPLYAYIPIVYTDTVVMLFPILSSLFYFMYYSTNSKRSYFFLLLCGITLTIGILIKTNVIIIMVGIVIHYIMTHSGWKQFAYIGLIFVPFLLINSIYQKSIEPLIPIEKKEIGFPFTHWIMMGLADDEQGPGSYFQKDVDFTERLKNEGFTNDQIKEEHIKVMQSRLDNYGLEGYLSFLSRKINFTWGDGTYFSPQKLSRSPLTKNIFQDYVFGEKSGGFKIICHMIQVSILTLVFIAGIGLVKSTDKFEQVLTITLFGVFLFLLLWETRSRYLVLYIPIILVLAIYGLGILNIWINHLKWRKFKLEKFKNNQKLL